MKHTNRDFIVAYLMLMAPTLLGLTGVLMSKRTLAAPVSVGGVWRIQADADQMFVLPCKQSLAPANASFTITQSGRSFKLDLAGSAMFSGAGVVQKATITAKILPAATRANEAECKEARGLNLTATVNSNVNPQLLAGVLSVADCPECARVHFRAVREGQSKVKEGN